MATLKERNPVDHRWATFEIEPQGDNVTIVFDDGENYKIRISTAIWHADHLRRWAAGFIDTYRLMSSLR